MPETIEGTIKAIPVPPEKSVLVAGVDVTADDGYASGR
jgi:hypothetical protein